MTLFCILFMERPSYNWLRMEKKPNIGGECAFSYTDPQAQNDLPNQLRSNSNVATSKKLSRLTFLNSVLIGS